MTENETSTQEFLNQALKKDALNDSYVCNRSSHDEIDVH